MEQCHVGEDESHLIIVIDRPLPQISTKQKLFAISKLASFMGLDQVCTDYLFFSFLSRFFNIQLKILECIFNSTSSSKT